MKEIEIIIGENKGKAILLEDKAPKLCKAIWNSLPLESTVNHAKIAGAEIFWMTKLILDQENETYKQEAGNITYWPDRQTICIFLEDHPGVGNVTLFAKVVEGLKELQKAEQRLWLKQGEIVTVRKIE